MQYHRVGKWGLRLPEISLGLWHNFGGTTPLERSREIVRRAFELGISVNGAAQESNLPSVGLRRRTGFEGCRALRAFVSQRLGLRVTAVACAPVVAPVDWRQGSRHPLGAPY
jgi:hypothetical protein